MDNRTKRIVKEQREADADAARLKALADDALKKELTNTHSVQ